MIELIHVLGNLNMLSGYPLQSAYLKINADVATSKNNNVGAVAAIARSGDGKYLGALA